MYSSWEIVDCPRCGQPKGQRCRTLKTGKSTDTHTARINLAHDERRKWR